MTTTGLRQDDFIDLDQPAVALFCLGCADRLLACCWAFEATSGFSLGQFHAWRSSVLNAVIARTWRQQDFIQATSELDELVPRSDDYGSCLATQAQAGVRCLLGAAAALAGAGGSPAAESAELMEDALDNFQFFVCEEAGVSRESLNGTELLQRERSWQRTTVGMLRRLEVMTASQIAAWCAENRQYSIPIALSFPAKVIHAY